MKRFSSQHEEEHSNIPNLVSEGSMVSTASNHTLPVAGGLELDDIKVLPRTNLSMIWRFSQ